MDNEIRLSLSLSRMDLGRDFELGPENFTLFVSDIRDEVSSRTDPEYEQFLADVWVGIVLTLMVLSCVCCMCSCLLYHKFQQWKRNVLEARRNAANIESGPNAETESLPSYTIVSGLPSYDEALEQLRQVRNQTKEDTKTSDVTNSEPWVPHTPPTPMARLSVSELFNFYKTNPTVPPVESKT